MFGRQEEAGDLHDKLEQYVAERAEGTRRLSTVIDGVIAEHKPGPDQIAAIGTFLVVRGIREARSQAAKEALMLTVLETFRNKLEGMMGLGA